MRTTALAVSAALALAAALPPAALPPAALSTAAFSTAAFSTAAFSTAAFSTAAHASAGGHADLGRRTLPANDGWASAGTGTTGGAAAPAANVHVVSDRAGLVAALASPGPRIVYVKGVIDVDRTCADFATGGYTLDGYLAAYDPAVWGRDTEPSGPLEDARAASAAAQTAYVKLKVPSDTTIVGLPGATIRHINLHVDKADNVIIRDIHFQDAADCFPQWDPTDGDEGNWNSLYDNVSVTGSTHVWIDHNTFDDGGNPDSRQPLLFGRPYQVHDGETDITNGSDLVTVSWNEFADHDKTMLIGSTNNPAADSGRLRVTVHHNHFVNTLQRLPRVRFGQVHVYDNYYEIPDASAFVYALGVGVQSQIVAQDNLFRLGRGVDPADLLHDWGGTALTATGNLLRVGGAVRPIDLVAAYNAAHDPDFAADAGWTPTLHTGIDPAASVRREVSRHAGAGKAS
ncbi:pectate lyase family protein [Microbispora sp. ATCC PTA-5024]|uniref:pectate lyase family protein n=1 Tax=Microbispora sp. ATCC PTA-5024 TaxID=316330 RepID=UPI0003DDED16|nr:pectate lyase [Microbispora sp. ATCC PTA-5024]ETK35755.1 pectate lyase [Microbispora sp. ATCC PTA-5024]